jgi:hypothetical protein
MICILYLAAFSAAFSGTPSAAAPRATAVSAPAEIGTGAFAFTLTKVDTGVHALGQSFLRTEEQAGTSSST